jgi:hypothetical protein
MKTFLGLIGILAILVVAGFVIEAVWNGVIASIPTVLKYVLLPAAIATVAFLVLKTLWIFLRNVFTGRINTSSAWSEIGGSMVWMWYVVCAATPLAVVFAIIRFSPLGVLTFPVAIIGLSIAVPITWYLMRGVRSISSVVGRAILRGFRGY